MKSITVNPEYPEKADAVFFDTATGRLSVMFGGILRSIQFTLIPASDFESSADVVRFSLGYENSAVFCHHADGDYTALPVDMWWPGGFTPPAPVPRGAAAKTRPANLFAAEIIAARRAAGLTQSAAAEIGKVPLRTLQDWEQSRITPPLDRQRAFVTAISTVPSSVRRPVLAESPTPYLAGKKKRK